MQFNVSPTAHHSNSKRKTHSAGQTMMEYIILVAVLAIASIPVAKILGNVFRTKVMSAADAMVKGKSQAKTFDGKAEQLIREGEQKVDRDMSNFGETTDDE
jgi:hypothetical protein